MGILDTISTKNDIRKLSNYKSDLSNDYSAIQRYNGHVEAIISDIQSFLRNGYSDIVSKLYDFKEPYQYNDGNLSTACNYIQYEINRLNQKLSDDD